MANTQAKDNTNTNIDLVNRLLISILDKKILELLKTISSNYPDKFPKKNINLEFEFIKNNIKFIKTDKPAKSDKADKPVSGNNILIGNINVGTIVKRVIKKVLDVNRCNARIWNNIYDRETLKEVSDIDKKFKVKDFKGFK